MKRLTILSHNAFWFQGASFATDRPAGPLPGVLRSLTQIYRALAPDALCLQEIQDKPTFLTLASSLRMDGEFTPGGTLKQYGGATLWREGVFARDSASSPVPAQRMWQAVDLSTGRARRIRVCNIHLPSSRQLGPAAGGQRLEELARAIEQDPRPDVVVGDFNEPPGGPTSQYMARQRYRDAAVVAGQAFRPTGLGGGRGDYIWIDQALREPLMEYGVLARDSMRVPGGGTEFLSDHFPLWITLRLGRPDR